MCVAIPDDGENGPRPGETVFGSMEECQAVCDDTYVACNPVSGRWRVHRATTGILLFGDETNQVFTFSDTGLDADGYRWYSSSAEDDGGRPIISLGFLEEVVNGERRVSMKVVGRLRISGKFKDMWSTENGVGSVDDPAAFLLGVVDDRCFELDSVDLSELCESGACMHRNAGSITKNPGRIILQREELCGDDVWVGTGNSDGTLDPAKCP
jgi:hypothetical protein